MLKSIKKRDKSDYNRKISPLKKTKDSVLINTTNLSKRACFLKKLEGDVAVAETDLRTFLAQPIGVAEHIDYVDTAEKKTAKLAEAKDKLEAIKNL